MALLPPPPPPTSDDRWAALPPPDVSPEDLLTWPDQATPADEQPVDELWAELDSGASAVSVPTAVSAGVGVAAPLADLSDRPAIVAHLRSESGLDVEGEDPPVQVARPLGVRSVDDTASFWGALAGSLALVWVLYERILPFSGTVGFVVCWFAAFLVVYSSITALTYPRPIVVDRVVGVVVTAGAAVSGFALAWTILWIFLQGLPALLHPNFYLQDMAGVGLNDPLDRGGVSHAIVGSAIQVGIATLISLPLGLGTAVYMTEVGGRLSQTVRTVVEAMTALPDILAGLFVYAVLIITLGWDRSGLAAALGLAVTMTPIIARSAEVVLRVVPGGLREASLALGASQWETIRRVVIPTAKAGLATSLILGIARIAGETAPLLIVSGASSFLNANATSEPMNSLPLFIYDAVRRPDGLTIQSRGYGAATLLLGLVLLLFVITRFLARDKGPSR